MSVTLGRTPEKLKVVVSPGGNFVSGIRRADASPWPAGVQLVLDFGAVEWVAENTDDLALWSKPAADVDAMIASRPRGVQLWYIDGASRLLWATGAVDRRA